MTVDVIAACAAAIAERLGDGGVMYALTGAGISRESGVPTYRGLDGVWSKVPEEIATPETLHQEPELFWEFHDALRQMLVTAEPNAAHVALAEMEEGLAGDAWHRRPACEGGTSVNTGRRDACPTRSPATREFAVVTQNIDGLHQAAGSRKVIELHGNATRNYCTACHLQYPDLPSPLLSLPPRCQCGGLIRPDVVLFNENLPVDALTEADRLASAADVVLVIGTSALVYPAAQFPLITWQNGGLLVEVNPEATGLSDLAAHRLRGPAGTSLPALWAALEPLVR